MTNDIDLTESNKAKDALDLIQDMETAGLKRGITPLWYGLTMALLGGIVFTMTGMEMSRLYMAPFFLIMVFSTIYAARKSGVIVRFPKRAFILGMIGVIAVLPPLIFLARKLREAFGFFGPLTLGVLVALVALIAFGVERYLLLTKIKTSKDE